MRAGDRAAEEYLYASISRLCRGDGEDAAHDLYIVVWRQIMLGRPENPMALWGYVSTIRRNNGVIAFRKSRPNLWIDWAVAHYEGNEASAEENAEQAYAKRQIDNLIYEELGKLKASARDTIRKVYILEMQQKDIAAERNRTVAAVKTAKARALKELATAVHKRLRPAVRLQIAA